MSSDILKKPIVLSLNRAWQVIGHRTVEQAIVAMNGGREGIAPAVALDIGYARNDDGSYDYDQVVFMNPCTWDEWIKLPVRDCDVAIHSAKLTIRAPTIIVAMNFNKMPVHMPRVSRQAIFERDGGKCFPKGTLITLANGRTIPIEDIQIGDELLSHTGAFRKVKHVFKRASPQSLKKIKTIGNFEICATEDHPFLTVTCCPRRYGKAQYDKINKRHLTFTPANQLKVGDFLLSPIPQHRDYIPVVRFDKTSFVKNRGYTDTTLTTYHQKIIDRYINVDMILGLLIGLYAAEGCAGDKKAIFCLHQKEEYLINTIKGFAQHHKLGVSLSFAKDNLGTQVIITSVVAEGLFKYLVPGKVDTKRLNPICFDLAPEIKRQILLGWALGDGQILHNKNINRTTVTTVSPDLCQDMLALAREMGMHPNLHSNKRANRRRAYILNFCGENNALLSGYDLRDLEGLKSNKKPRIQIDGTSYWLIPIQKIDDIKHSGYVYNLEVETDNSYVANGFAVHNCQFTGEYIGRAGTLDHLVPVSRGGKNSFENIVWSKKEINSFKADRTPEEAGLHLIRQPKAPKPIPDSMKIREARHPDHKHFILK